MKGVWGTLWRWTCPELTRGRRHPAVTVTRCSQAAAAGGAGSRALAARPRRAVQAGDRPSHTHTADRVPVWGPRASPRGQRPPGNGPLAATHTGLQHAGRAGRSGGPEELPINRLRGFPLNNRSTAAGGPLWLRARQRFWRAPQGGTGHGERAGASLAGGRQRGREAQVGQQAAVPAELRGLRRGPGQHLEVPVPVPEPRRR